MASLTAPIRSIKQRLRTHWRGTVVLCALVVVLGSFALTMLNNQSSHADRRYREAAAEADRLDPSWRLDDILAGRERIPDNENSALQVREIAAKLPGAWPGIKLYDPSFLPKSETPEVRLSREAIAQLQNALEAAEDIVPAARRLAESPRGQLDDMRPKSERLEQVAGLNASVDVNFPYGDSVRRVSFLLWVDAKLRIEAGDVETAILDLRAMDQHQPVDWRLSRAVGSDVARRRVLAGDRVSRDRAGPGTGEERVAGSSPVDIRG